MGFWVSCISSLLAQGQSNYSEMLHGGLYEFVATPFPKVQGFTWVFEKEHAVHGIPQIHPRLAEVPSRGHELAAWLDERKRPQGEGQKSSGNYNHLLSASENADYIVYIASLGLWDWYTHQLPCTNNLTSFKFI